ncbi:hypothetical protein [Psychrobacter urativorans]|uniref:Integrase n=1 Tax=Psychrobacter urativorans TaxID=45610 RepID=A0A0M4U3D9_9GAMM|nr:hypothetical protein [Psychrobacter urativorans]ALF58906.1 hypothetical protein AOC03_01610 [Psychrobacter urativorans]
MQLNNYNKFIDEQKEYFENSLYKPNDALWTDSFWLKTGVGSSWLLSRGKSSISFDAINRVKGLPNINISADYQQFCKAMLVYSYRQANGKVSPQKLVAELLVLKRWFYYLGDLTSDTHPTRLSTEILNHAYSLLKDNSSPINLPDHVGTFKRLQDIVNKSGFTSKKLEFEVDLKYINKQNRTQKARVTKELLEGLNIDESKIDAEKLISIQTFINIASLKNLCQSEGEKILLNSLFLSIVTGFRSAETIILKKDCLIERPILDPQSNEPISINGKLQYMIGIRYYGAKGAGERIHWVEPSSITLVKSIIQNTLELTEEYREHLIYLRQKNLKNFLPKGIDEMPDDLIELDDLIDHLFISKKRARGRAGRRDSILKTFKSAQVRPDKKSELKLYSKKTLNEFIKSTANYDAEEPINKKFAFEGKIVNVPYEDILFIVQSGSTTLSRNLINKTNITPLDIHVINNFLGSGMNKSVFEKYGLKDNDSQISKISSHIPRHNINTFLAIAEISDHLQAMLMGRVDIEQNKHYQHLSIKQISQNASLTSNSSQFQTSNELMLASEPVQPVKDHIKSPIDDILECGLMLFSNDQDLENNLKNNLHTFDNTNEISNFIEQSMGDDYFEDIAKAFNELAPTEPDKAKELIHTHAYLHPLLFGSCMRNIAAHGCPKRLACQSGASCVNFTVTGRMGELENLKLTKDRLIEQSESLADNSEFMLRVKRQIQNLEDFEQRIIVSYSNKTPLNIYTVSDTELSQPKTLAELFSLEYENTKANDEEEGKC